MKRLVKQQKPLGWREATQVVAGEQRAPFRGEIWEFFKDVPMAQSFQNKGRPFDINTANYLREPLHEIRVRPYGMFIAKAAVQSLKTNAFIEQSAGYLIANNPGNMTIFFTGDSTNIDRAKSRLNPYVRAHPAVAKLIDDVWSASSDGRFNITTEALYLPSMALRVWPLNLASTQGNTLRYVLISDAFLAKKDGFIREAIARTRQHNTREVKDYKIIIESQGGEDGDDFDAEWQITDQRILHVTCIHCARSQPFEWHRVRGEEFEPTPPTVIPSLDHAAWISENRKLLLTPERKHAGMKRGDRAKLEDGSYNHRAVLSDTYYECYYCGGAWKDDSKTRYAIDSSSCYVKSYEKALPENNGWWWPGWCGQRLEWGGIMLEYLQAKEAVLSGNDDKLRQWYQKWAARSWNPNIERHVYEISPGSYDPNQLMPDEFCRNMGTDCQQDQAVKDATGKSVTGYFWYVVRVIDKFGNSRQLARGFCKSWKDLIAVQHKWKVPNDRHCIDMAHWPEVVEKAAMEHEVRKLTDNPNLPFFLREKQVTWICMLGSEEQRFKHPKNVEKAYSQTQFLPVRIYDAERNMKIVTVKKVRWSNYQIKHQLDLLRSNVPGLPKFETLSREHLDDVTKEKEVGNFTYEKQMESEFVDQVRGRDKYETIPGGQPHYRDCECQILTRMAMDGQIGHLAETS